jgi:curved DNA-binding protein CbpA
MYFFPKQEQPPSMNEFSRPENSVLLDNRNQLDVLPVPIMDRPVVSRQFTKPSQQKAGNISIPDVNPREVLDIESDNSSNGDLDPYEVLGIEPNASLDEIKIAYKYLALKHHPDKGGELSIFNIIKDAYSTVSRRVQATVPKKKIEHNDLKKASKHDFTPDKNKIKINMSGKNFNLNKFNDVYDENKMKNPYDKGYSDWGEDVLDENISVVSNGSTNSFNEAFDKGRKINNYSKQIMKIDEPLATISGDLGFSELGQDDIVSFSKTEGDSNSIQFTDYKDAYTIDSKLINPNNIEINRPNTIGQFKNQREKVSYTMTEEQKRLEEISNKQAEDAEFNRMQRVNLFDEMANEQYNKANQFMLGK